MRRVVFRSLTGCVMSAAILYGLSASALLHADAPAGEEPVVVDKVPVEVPVEVPEDERTADKADKADSKKKKTVEIVLERPKLWLGIQLKAIEGDLAAYLKNSDGVLVKAVVADSPAAKAGLEEGDILLRLGERKLRKPEDLHAIIAELTPEGAKPVVLDITLLRNGSQMTIQITPEPRVSDKGSVQAFEWNADTPLAEVDVLLGNLVEGRLPHEMRVFRFGKPSINEEQRRVTGNLQVNISRDMDGKKIELSIVRQDNQPAKIKVTQEGQVSEYTESDLDKMPAEIKDIVKPLLDVKSQTRNSMWIDLPGDSDEALRLSIDHKELVEKVRNKAVEMAKQAREAADDARQRVPAKADEYLKSADEFRKSAERSVQEFASLPKQVEELRSLVDELRQEVKKLRAELMGDGKAGDKEDK